MSPGKDASADDLAHQLRGPEGGQVSVAQTRGLQHLRDGLLGDVSVLRHQPVHPGHQPQSVGQPGEVCHGSVIVNRAVMVQRLTWQLGGPGVGGGHDVERPQLGL